MVLCTIESAGESVSRCGMIILSVTIFYQCQNTDSGPISKEKQQLPKIFLNHNKFGVIILTETVLICARNTQLSNCFGSSIVLNTKQSTRWT